ncbi:MULTISPECIES: hypothetical protein [unclassified Nostoc]|nr:MULTISPECIES: hypothetical protein [unclassified Nostoc]MDZ8030416.1 hypothetical protein [Nostoc sp. DedSLP04]MDZ8092361.1 hypothetical protein [Nostoc sp. DedQUE05]
MLVAEVAVVLVVLVFWVRVVGHPAVAEVAEAKQNCFGMVVRD